MAYGEGLRQLNPLSPELIAEKLAGLCPPDAAVVDVGCGRGTTLRWLREHSDHRLYGVEADPDYAAACGAVTGRAEALPLADDSCDSALMECVFSLLDDPSRAAAELSRVLRPGGVLLLSDLYGRKGGAELAESALLRHIYTEEGLRKIWQRAGFDCLEFTDHTFEMQTLLAQMIMDGAACDCCEPANRALLKQVRAGYGLWVFRSRKGTSDARI